MGLFNIFSKKEAAGQNVSGKLINEDFEVAGEYYYTENIMKLACSNEDWKKDATTLSAEGKIGKKIFQYNFINKPVKLIPEPKNKHDKNAVQVIIAGELVGYISREDNVHVKEILSKREIKYISAVICGGEYKVASEDGCVKWEENINITVRLGYV